MQRVVVVVLVVVVSVFVLVLVAIGSPPRLLQDFVEKALDLHGCWDLQDLIPNCSNLERLVL